MNSNATFFDRYKVNVIGWILTVIMSAVGAWTAINTRMYELDKRLAIVEEQIKLESARNNKQDEMLAKIEDMFNQINMNILSLKETKADRKYTN
jgi:uncharacterized membrane protein (DUF106 family)